ncbi:hypothetical protein GLYMA_11G043500v4 [Glycine max]|nr:uncharacterized protein LOC102669922 [Glycine max]XP_028188437.1 uncharacterized protein LOC114374911 [Glycine soja]XP_028188438.1 uncharacterized protein LOC114374911 [Glycine soja]XP_040862521.1 uncharacterized protein LOC102669922 [Glycine max]KAH1157561.1 hypothetical protein GYH30_030003 [Glycine max]KRH28294.1 hypothetical protein GLYMA_11G043500v4 [Glycine max]
MDPDEQSKLEAKPELRKDWTCQECMPREGTNKLVQDEVEVAERKRKGHLFESSTDSESRKGSKLKSRSSCTGKSGENGAELLSRRPLVPVKKFKLKSVNKILYSGPERSSGETSFPGHRILVSNHDTHKDPNSPNAKKKNESQHGEQPTKAGTSMSLSELWTNPDFDGNTYLRNLASNHNTHKDPNFLNGKEKNESQQGEQPTKAGTSMSLSELWTNPDFDGNTYLRNLASNHNTHKDPNFLNGKEKNESQQGEQPTKAATSMTMYELRTDPAFDEKTYLRNLVHVEAAYLSHRVVPKADYKWLGKFQIHNSEGIARTWDGIQAHLSNCASVEVLEVANRLSEIIIILEELPRLRTWPSQFMRSQVTENDIALYFFAHDSDSYIYYEQLVNYMMNNDLALKGNLDGVELLIFPSNILPGYSQCWNGMFFLWGVFRGQKANNSASTPVSNSLKLKDGDAATILPSDLNVYPQDGDAVAIIDEIPESEPSGDTVLLVGENSDGKGGVADAEHDAVIEDINVSLWPESETQENGSVGIEDSLVPLSTPDSDELQAASALLLLAEGFIKF